MLKKFILLSTAPIILFFSLFIIFSNNAHAASINQDLYLNSISTKFLPLFEPLDSFELPILLYHYVENVKDQKDVTRRLLSTPPKLFEKQIVSLLDRGYTFVSFEDVNSYIAGERMLPSKPVILTLDDGYEDFYTDALPILIKHNVKATEFIITGFIDTPNYMNYDQIKKAISTGLVEIGSHTVHHYKLTELSKKEIADELVKSKKALKELFDIDVSVFAYPYGNYNRDVEAEVQKAGYLNAVTVDNGSLIQEDDLLNLPRVRTGIEVGDLLIDKIHRVDKS